MAGPIKIAILANASQAKREFGEVETRGQRLGRAINSGAKVAAGGFLLLGAAAVKAGQAAAEDEASQVKLAQTLKTGAGATRTQIAATESWITAQGKALGVADDELRPALGKLAIATGDVGQAQKLSALAMDVSAGSGKKLDAVSQALAKAVSSGSVTALGKYGVATKDADGKTRSLSAITSDLAAKYRGAASSAAETNAGKQRKLTVQLGELQEQLGAKLLPVMNTVAAAGLKAVEWASANEAKAKVLAIAVVALGAAFIAASVAMRIASGVALVYRGVMTVLAVAQGVHAAATGAGTAALVGSKAALLGFSVATKVAAAGQWLLNAALTANPIGIVVLAIVALVAIFVVAWQKSETFRSIVTGAWNGIKTAAVAVFGFLKTFLTVTWIVIKTVITTAVRTGLAVVRGAWTAIKTVTSTVWNGIKAVVSGVVGAVVGVVRGGFNTAKTVISTVWNAVKTGTTAAWNGIKTGVRTAITAVLGIVRGIKDRVVGVFTNAGSWLLGAGKRILQGLIDGISNMVGKVREKLSAVTNLIPDWKGPARRDARLLRPAGELIIGGLITGFDRRTPAVRRTLRGLSEEISSFSARPTAELSAAAVYQSNLQAREERYLALHLTADIIDQVQRGKSYRADIRAAEKAGARTSG